MVVISLFFLVVPRDSKSWGRLIVKNMPIYVRWWCHTKENCYCNYHCGWSDRLEVNVDQKPFDISDGQRALFL